MDQPKLEQFRETESVRQESSVHAQLFCLSIYVSTSSYKYH